MTDLDVVGTLHELREKLYRIKNVVDIRSVLGWNLLLEDEVWRYHTQQEKARVCPICKPLDLQDGTGRNVGELFPALEFLGDGIVHPHTHYNTDNPNPCYCRINFINSIQVVESRLHKEKLQVI